MDYETLYPGRFIKSADLNGKGDVTLVLKAITAEELDGKSKAIVSFEGTKKQLVLNRTNAESVKAMFGRETNDWLGKRITVFSAVIKDPFGDGTVGAIRVRGSPDISKPIEATIQRGRKTIKVSVIPTGKSNGKPTPKNGNGQAKAAPPEPPPISPEEQAEILARENGVTDDQQPF